MSALPKVPDRGHGLPQLMVGFARDRRGKTFVAQQRATHPFHLCRPLYRPGDPDGLATLYVQGCAGGLFEHDRVALSLAVSSDAQAHVTTAASTIVHRMPNGGHAEQDVRLVLARGALLEHVPDPAILFPRSKLRTRLSVRFVDGSQLIAIDSFLGHRLPDDEAPFDWYDSAMRIEDESGRLCARDRFVAEGASFRDTSVGGTGRFLCQGTVLVLGAGAAPLTALRAVWSERPGVMAGLSTLPGEIGVVGRVLANDGVSLRSALHDAWVAARVALGIVGAAARPK